MHRSRVIQTNQFLVKKRAAMMRIGNEKTVGNYTTVVHHLTNMMLYMYPHDIIQNINSFPTTISICATL